MLAITCLLGAEEPAKNKRVEVDARVVEAAAGGDLAALQTLIGQGASVNSTNEQGATALMAAAFFGQPQVVRALLRMGADVNHRSSVGHSALLMAVEKDETEIVRMLVDHGADVNVTDDHMGGTALLRAAELGNYDVVKLLIKKGADVNAETKEKKATALSLASAGWHLQITRLLLDNGAKGSKLVVLAQASDLKGVRQLLKDGADVNQRGPNGETALSMAAMSGSVQLVRLLLAAGANPTLTTDNRLEDGHPARTPAARVQTALALLEKQKSGTLSPDQQEDLDLQRFFDRKLKPDDLRQILPLLQAAETKSATPAAPVKPTGAS